MAYSEVDWADDELLGQVKLNQMCENLVATRGSTDVRLVAQLVTDWDFVLDGPELAVTFGDTTLLALPAFTGDVTAFDIDVSAEKDGLVDVVIGSVKVKFLKTPDTARASIWINLFGSYIALPTANLRIFNVTVTAHRLERGGY